MALSGHTLVAPAIDAGDNDTKMDRTMDEVGDVRASESESSRAGERARQTSVPTEAGSSPIWDECHSAETAMIGVESTDGETHEPKRSNVMRKIIARYTKKPARAVILEKL